MNLQRLVPTVVATLICWLSMGLVVALTPSGAFIRDVVMVFAFLATAMLWVMWAVVGNSASAMMAAASEKAKRRTGSDPNVALLLELLSEDERAEIKERLLDRYQADGEMTSLAELVDDQDERTRQRR